MNVGLNLHLLCVNAHAAICVTVKGGLGKVLGTQIHLLRLEKVTGL